MDPITGMILAAMVVAGVIVSGARATSDVLTASRASKAGAWDFLDRQADRHEARRAARREALRSAWDAVRRSRHRQAGGDGNYRPGMGAYLRDVYGGFWADQLAKREAKRAVRPEPAYWFDPESGRVRRQDRPAGRSVKDRVSALLDKADAAIVAKATAVRQSRLGRAVADSALVRPVGERREPPVEGVSVFADPPSPPPDPWVFSEPVADSEATVRIPHPQPADSQPDATTDDDSVFEPAAPVPTNPNDQGGTAMTAPTGEAVNYETHKAEIAAARDLRRSELDAASAAAQALASAKAALNEHAEQARRSAAAAAAKSDSLAGAGLDGETQAHAGLQADAVDVNRLDAQFEQIEAMEADVAAAAQAAEAALASLDAEEATVDAKYGDAHATVAGELGGNASYLDSAGSAGGGFGGGSANVGAVAYGDEDVSVSGRAIGGQGGDRDSDGGGGNGYRGSGGSATNVGVIGDGATMANSAVGDGATVVHHN